METSQQKFILEELNSCKVCEIQDKYIDNIKEVSTIVIRNILNQKFFNGSNMKALLCLFHTLILSTAKTKEEKGLYNLSKDIQKWIIKTQKLGVNSVEGIVYITDIFVKDIQVIIKTPQEIKRDPKDTDEYFEYRKRREGQDAFESIIREYFIGIKSMNKLRYLTPSFVYTFGAFLCPIITPEATKICTSNFSNVGKNNAFVLYERIPGESLEKLIKTNEINFNQWLLIFIQTLLGLEVAQREVRFTHFDLHTDNLMVRKKDNFNYTIPLDINTYNIKDPELIPVIIDLGTSSSYIENRYIGCFDFAKYGMLNFMVPGYDMYKLMLYSLLASYKYKNKELVDGITSLFRFYDLAFHRPLEYGSDDPYGILHIGLVGVQVAESNYCALASYSRAATYTPLMMVEWIMNEYKDILSPNIIVTDRKEYLPIIYSSTIKEYDDIFKHNKEGQIKAINIINSCIKTRPSYVMTKYNIQILEKYNISLLSTEISDHIKRLNNYLKINTKLVDVDKAMLQKVFNIPIPTQDALTDIRDTILSIPIREYDPDIKRKATEALNILVYQEMLNPYLQFYFTIYETKTEDIFVEWIQDFLSSEIYKFYTNNASQNERVIRWGQTLLASIL